MTQYQYGEGEWIENMEGDLEWAPAEEVVVMTREPLPFKQVLKENKEIINQIANKCDEAMGHHPFSKADFKNAIDEILIDQLGSDYMSKPIDINRNEIVAEICNWLSDYLGDY